MTVKYSVCVCNYNMADTIEQALVSVLAQLDETFEMIVVDDGSSDNSLEVLKSLQEKYENLRVKSLSRDNNRKLGTTRNISISEAKGEYVLLHIDCDDIFGPYLKDFVEVFHQIEKAAGKDILLCGGHITMARKDFLLARGPYRNIYRGEDRDMLMRLAAEDALILLEHENFVTRLPKVGKTKVFKAFYDIWYDVLYDFMRDRSFAGFISAERVRKNKKALPVQIYRYLLMIPAFIKAGRMEGLELPDNMRTSGQFTVYKEKAKGTFAQIMSGYGGKVDYSRLCDEAKGIFK